MSDSYERLVDTEVTAKEAPALAKKVVARLREVGLIAGSLNKKCVLSGSGYLPGPKIAELFPLGGDGFWELITCGVEPIVGRHCNYDVFMYRVDSTCPSCGKSMNPKNKSFFNAPDDAFIDSVSAAMQEWEKESSKTLVTCPKCKKKKSVDKWIFDPPIGFGNLSFSFWNWPPFSEESCVINIPDLMREVTGHEIIRTYGRI